VDASRDMKLAHFMWQVKQRWDGHPEATYALVSADARPFDSQHHCRSERSEESQTSPA
jgi:hypothetical protein